MPIHLHGGSGCAVILTVLIGPGLLAAYFLRSAVWAVIVPVGLVVLMLVAAALPTKRKVTPEKFADELEKHLIGTEGTWDWDDAISVRISDERLERLRLCLGARFDSLSRQEDRDELSQVIAALRRGEIPYVKQEPRDWPNRSGLIRLHLND